MATAPGFNRRALFQTMTGVGGSTCPTRRELVVARRAMACEFSIFFPAGTRQGVDAGCAALDEVERLEAKLSVYRGDSDLSYINRYAAESPVRADAEVYRLLRSAGSLSATTAGAFDSTSGALVKAWGFFQGPRRVPSDEERRRALTASGWRQVRFNDAGRTIQFAQAGVEFNLGGIGKGFAIDRALHVTRRQFGIRCALMQGGQSSLAAIGAPPGDPLGWPVAIGDPLHEGQTLATVRLRDRAMGTSGSANQFFVQDGRRYGHILDPRTGWPARGVYSASAVAPTAAQADALSTAFYVMGFEATRQYCREHTEVGAVMVVPGSSENTPPCVRVIGAVAAEVLV
jgi:thiamine biosynthesis lipoprotein